MSVDQDLADTTDLICNTFDAWNTNIEGDIQIACALPDGVECEAYSATSTVIGSGTEPFTWTLASGTYRLESASHRMATSPARFLITAPEPTNSPCKWIPPTA